MQKTFLWSLLLLLGIFVATGFALPSGAIYDTYLHPNDDQLYQRDDDVIGNPAYFDILGHQWFATGLEIYLRWDLGENGHHLNAMLGDVFFYGPSGKGLEYFVPVRDHSAYDGDGSAMLKGNVYSVEDTLLSNTYYPPPGWSTSNFGDNEVVTGVSTETGKSYFTVNTSTGEFPYNIISLEFLGADDLDLFGRGIRFAFTCGNDVHAPVPEPATLILFGTGLIGLAGLGRRKFKRQ